MPLVFKLINKDKIFCVIDFNSWVIFKLRMPHKYFPRVLLFRSTGHVDDGILTHTPSEIEERLKEFPAAFIVRQKRDEPSAIIMQCCSKERLETIIDSMNAADYTTGICFYIRVQALFNLVLPNPFYYVSDYFSILSSFT